MKPPMRFKKRKQNIVSVRIFGSVVINDEIFLIPKYVETKYVKGALSRPFCDLFSKTAPKLRLSTFNHAGNAPRT